MEQKECPVLYDFLYKDIILCKSLYSQLFEGVLTTSKSSKHLMAGSDRTGEGSIPGIAKAQYIKRESRSSNTEIVLDPHDIIVMQTMVRLAPFAKNPCAALRRGDIFVATGQLRVFDRQRLSSDIQYEMTSESAVFSGMLKELFLTSSLEAIAFVFGGESISPITLFGIVERPSFVKPIALYSPLNTIE